MAHAPPPVDGTLMFETNMDGVEVFVDGMSHGVVNKGTPLRLPGLRPGSHTIQGVKLGYEPDGPREETVYPGRESTVTRSRFLIARRRPKAALDQLNDGLAFYNKGFADNYKKAVGAFRKGSRRSIRPTARRRCIWGAPTTRCSTSKKSEAAFRKAIEIDPDYLEARVSLAGMLLDIGAVDESIRQLNVVTQRDKSQRGGALYAGAGVPHEGTVSAIDRFGARGDHS